MSAQLKRNLILVLGVLGGSTSCLFARWSNAPAAVLACYRMLLTVLLMAPYMWLKYRDELRLLEWRQLRLCLLSGLCLGLHFTCYFSALNQTSVAAAQTLTSAEVFFVAIVSWLLWRERVNKWGWLGVALTFGGGVVIAMGDVVNAQGAALGGGGAVLGDLLALAAALTMGCYTLIGRRSRRSLSTGVYTFLVYGAAVITLLLLLLVSGTQFGGYGAVNWFNALGMALCCTLGGHTIFSWSLKYFPAPHVSTVKLLDPVFSTCLGLLFLADLPSVTAVLGSLVIIGGTLVYIRSGN